MAYTTIDLPTDYFNTTLYTGTASNNITLTMDNIGFLWIKRRNATGGHVIFDSVRGGHYTGSGAKPVLITNVTSAAQGTDIDSATKGINFGSTSTVIGSDSQGYNYNTSGGSYVAWHWAGGGSASSNTDGSITSTVSANQTSGFSVVTTTGTGSNATIGHGLGAAPAMIIGKRRDSGSSQWRVYNKNLSSNSHILFLDTTDAEQGSNSATWNNTAPTSSVFSVGTSGDVNASSGTFVFYCFAEKKGFSKFGSYTGNGNADGPFIYTGFKPAFTILKKSSGTDNWVLHDNKRSDVPNANPNDQVLYPNASDAELSSATREIDTLSNGFKCRATGGNINASGETYIYMAFAEAPFVSSGGGVPTTAR